MTIKSSSAISGRGCACVGCCCRRRGRHRRDDLFGYYNACANVINERDV